MPGFLNSKILAPVAPLALASVLINAQPAQAILNYYIYESGVNVVLETSGSLNLSAPGSTANSTCTNVSPGGTIRTNPAILCTGPDAASFTGYSITGPSSISGTAGSVLIGPASSTSGLSAVLAGAASTYFIQSSHTSGPIVSNAVFNNQTLAGLGFIATGLIGTWTLNGSGDTINLCIANPASPCGASPSAASAPGPLPLFGAAAAFGFSRRLRRRVRLSRSTAQSSTTISA